MSTAIHQFRYMALAFAVLLSCTTFAFSKGGEEPVRALSSSPVLVTVPFCDSNDSNRKLQENTQRNLRERFLEEVVVPDPGHSTGCQFCGMYQCSTWHDTWNAGVRSFQDPIVSGQVCGITAIVFGTCNFDMGIEVFLNGNYLGLAQNQNSDCSCSLGLKADVIIDPMDPSWYKIGDLNEIRLDEVEDFFICVNRVELQLVTCNTPPVAQCEDIVTIESPGSCQGAMVEEADVDAGSYHPDGTDIELSLKPSGPFAVGTTRQEVTLTVTDSEGESDSCVSEVTVVDIDSDGDGIFDCQDACPNSVRDEPLEFLPNHSKFDGKDFFSMPPNGNGNGEDKGSSKSFTMDKTHGCSCTQIVDECGYGYGHIKHGCSSSVMESFSDEDGPFCKDADGEIYKAFSN